jgi:hypothetical protein
MALPAFEKALASAPEGKKPHLLLGNGFSRAWRDDIFSYESLFTRADFGDIPLAELAFAALDTTDFEVVMDALQKAAQLISVYASEHPQLAEQLAHDAEKLKDVLVQAIAENHPDHPFEIEKEQYAKCKQFLSNFEKIFTVNYDLLFRKPDSGEPQYVSWEPENTRYQTIYYLHGALHIFDSQTEVKKFTWAGTGIRLIEQVRSALDQGMYPLFVAEGESRQKYTRIRHSDFLDKTYRSLLSCGSSKTGGCMFIYGHSLAANDEHILRGIVKSCINRLYVGIYGDPDSDDNKRIMKRAQQMSSDRKKGLKLEIEFYDSGTASIWK